MVREARPAAARRRHSCLVRKMEASTRRPLAKENKRRYRNLTQDDRGLERKLFSRRQSLDPGRKLRPNALRRVGRTAPVDTASSGRLQDTAYIQEPSVHRPPPGLGLRSYLSRAGSFGWPSA